MKRLMWALPCVAVVLFAGSAVLAKDAATSRAATTQAATTQAKEKVVLPGYWGSMAGELKLNDEMKAKIQDKLQPLQDWDKANSAKLVEIAKQAKDTTDKDAKAKLMEKTSALMQDREKLMEKIKVDVMALLTAEQRVQWRAAELYNGQAYHFSKLNLTQAQVMQARTLAQTYAKQILELKSPIDDKALKDIRAAYVKEVTAKVLTDDQRSKLDAAASKPASTEKK